MKITFKQCPKNTGLSAVGGSSNGIDVKHNKKVFAHITGKSWQVDHIFIMLAFEKSKPDDNPNCSWKWMQTKEKFDSEESAKKYLIENIDKLVSGRVIHYFEN